MSKVESSSPDPTPAGGNAPGPSGHWHKRSLWVAAAVVAVIVVVVLWRIVEGFIGGGVPKVEPVPVVVAPVQRGDFVVYQFAPGTVTPINTVTVRSRVDGTLTGLHFKDGQMVKQGALLATIDPQPFRANLALATGKLAGDQAALENARAVLKRYRTLLAEDSIERQRVDDQASQVAQYAAAVKSDQGRVDVARLQLSDTRITAPISGMIGLRQVDPGNLVGPSNADGIARITQLSPTGVVFAVPAKVLPPVMQRLHAGDPIAVVAYGTGQDDVLGRGRLSGANNRVDPATGTIKLKAEFANPHNALFPDQPVTVKMPVRTVQQATLVPTAAIQQGAAGQFVYVVGKNHVVAVVPVRVGPGDGTTSVIEHGIAPGAEVVIEGADRLRAGTQVAPTPQAGDAVSGSHGARAASA